MMKIARTATAATVAAAAVGGVLMGAAQASADESSGSAWTLKATGATVKFWAEGDVFRIYDTKKDGKAAHFNWYMPYNGDAGNGVNSGGYGTNKKYASKNLVDDKVIQICVWRTGGRAACGSTST